MSKDRPTNKELCTNFRKLLTEDASVSFQKQCVDAKMGGLDEARLMNLTKPWRNDLWKAFREIEDRLCPLEAMERERNGNV